MYLCKYVLSICCSLKLSREIGSPTFQVHLHTEIEEDFQVLTNKSTRQDKFAFRLCEKRFFGKSEQKMMDREKGHRQNRI